MSFNKRLATALKRHIQGDVRDDSMSQQIYSVDASILEVTPLLVTLPKTKEDLVTIVKIAQEFEIPITARGGATGIAGGCLGRGIIIDTSKYLTQILECNAQKRTVLCEPGVIQDQLNAAAAPYGLRLGPDTSTGNRATLGGMCATNAAGAHYLKYGNMIDHVLEVEMILSSGEVIQLGENSSWPGLPTLSSAPTFHRSSSGYALYTLLESPRNLAKLTIGSEGTLGVFSTLKLKLSEMLRTRSLVLMSFDSLEESLKVAPFVLSHHPISLEVIDHHVIAMGRLSAALKGKLSWLNFDTQALLIAEFESATPPSLFPSQRILLDPQAQEEVWMLRKAGLGLLLSRRSYSRAIAFIEDLALPCEHLAEFVRELKNLIPWEMGIYGHAGDGCLHTRPYVTVSDPKEIEKIFELMPQVAELVRRYGGVLSGEHGDGLIRSWLNPTFFGPYYEAMVQVKEAFDPLNLMNPEKVVKGRKPQDWVRKSHPQEISTFLDFTPEGGFHLAVDLCNGNGACRKTTGLMCPSFHAFKDERHTTRARAESLRSILNGRLPMKELTEKGLLDVLDYCLGCKGCKKECPSAVDMAKMKMEMLFHYQEKKGYFLKNRLFGNLHSLASFGSQFPLLANALMRFATPFVGVSSKRPLPSLSGTRFTSWWAKRERRREGKKQIHLFIDTFTEFYSPSIGMAAAEVLERMGFTVNVLPPRCCGRPFLSVGMLKEAKEQASALVEQLKPLKEPIIVLEPSCLSAINDDYPPLIHSSVKVFSLEEILTEIRVETPIFYHPHCHEQALSSLPLKSLFPSLILSQAGCCGLAGSFGYERKHYPMSMAIAESRLFPQIRQLEEGFPLVASGFSCRQQIHHGLGLSSLHPAEILLRLI